MTGCEGGSEFDTFRTLYAEIDGTPLDTLRLADYTPFPWDSVLVLDHFDRCDGYVEGCPPYETTDDVSGLVFFSDGRATQKQTYLWQTDLLWPRPQMSHDQPFINLRSPRFYARSEMVLTLNRDGTAYNLIAEGREARWREDFDQDAIGP